MAPQPVWARSDEEKAAVFTEYLATVYTPLDDLNDNDKERQLSENSTIIPEIKRSTKRNSMSRCKKSPWH
jgi:hypothetical protein